MKILLIACLLVISLSNQVSQVKKINVPCIEEIGYLTKDLFVFGLDIARRKFCSEVKDVVVIIMEIIKLKKACSSSDNKAILEEHDATLMCLQNTYDLAESAYQAYQNFIENGLTDDLIDQASAIQQLLIPTLGKCNNRAKYFQEVFPQQCIVALNDIAKAGLSIKNQRKQPIKMIEGFVEIGENFQLAREHCPFMQ